MAPARDEEDTRKVQTAVLGGPDGHDPVFLPFEKKPAAKLRDAHGANAFTCGALLGGCGKLLTLRACDDKKSHFAHRPPVRCSRTALGENSADHLYIGKALGTWLRRQGQTGVTVHYAKQRHARSDTIEITFGPRGRRRLLHVQMIRRSFADWQADGRSLATRHRGSPLVRMYGPDSQLAAYEVDASGYALRFRCETENGTRVVFVGTQLPDHTVEWTSLDQCRLLQQGILTPWLEQGPGGIRPRSAARLGKTAEQPAKSPAALPARSFAAVAGPATARAVTAAPPVFPLAPGSVAFTGASPSLVATSGPRRTYDAEAQPRGSTTVRARISLPDSQPLLDPHAVYVLTEGAALVAGPRSTDVSEPWHLRAERIRRLSDGAATAWTRLTPPPRPVRVEVAPRVELAPPLAPPVVAAPARPANQSAEPRPAAPEPVPTREQSLALAMTRTLVDTARAGTTVTWYELLRANNIQPKDVSSTRRLALLMLVDTKRAEDGQPLLSALITLPANAASTDEPPSFFRHVLQGCGLVRASDTDTVARIRTEHQHLLHRAHRQAEPAAEVAPAAAMEKELARLEAVLDILDGQEATPTFRELYHALEEADRLEHRIGRAGLIEEVRKRLNHWRTVFLNTQPPAPPPPPTAPEQAVPQERNQQTQGLLGFSDDPNAAFSREPLLMLGVVRQSAEHGQVVPAKLLSAMARNARRISELPVAAVRDELSKLLTVHHPSQGLRALVDGGLAAHLLPELPALRSESAQHHRHPNIYEHTLAVLEQVVALEMDGPDLVLRLAALLHDMGTPRTRRTGQEGHSTFLHHEVVGAKMARQRLRALDYPAEVVADVARLVELHGRFNGYDSQQWTNPAVRRYARAAGPLADRLHRLVRADCSTRDARSAERWARAYEELEGRIARTRAADEKHALRPDLDGHRIMEILGLRSGTADVSRAYQFMCGLREEHGPMSAEDAETHLRAWWAVHRTRSR
ncbi:HDIG domain-containing metalloprotein [Kitasatospora sp. NPDC097691]|uniref:HDIG domain-containing metalloprotein n=1 Tax=Kitasatospora sp. NPDC097691 TaxID=3157231 RepID=UPI00332E1B6A